MASRPKLQRMITTVKELAAAELGQSAEPVDFIVHRICSGQSVTALALDVAEAMGEPASRSWLSWRFNHLTPDAKERLAAARGKAAQRGKAVCDERRVKKEQQVSSVGLVSSNDPRP
jgi:uncharacterized protein (DUF2237 family)